MHYLKIFRKYDEENDEYDYWEIVHDPDCPVDVTRFFRDYGCRVGGEISNCGLDSLDTDWKTLEPGVYPIEPWTCYHERCNEWDGGLKIVEEFPPAL